MNKFMSDERCRVLLEDLHSLMCDIPMTLGDIARDVGISRATLSRFINGHSVGYKTMRQIEGYIKYKRDESY